MKFEDEESLLSASLFRCLRYTIQEEKYEDDDGLISLENFGDAILSTTNFTTEPECSAVACLLS